VAKWLSVAVSGVIGAVLAALAAWGVISANTAAPSHNPASAQIVDYGNH
jgi:hypothetical protein